MAVVRKVGVPMRTVVLAASKGGVGKTTLAAALAVRAAEESGNVALIDLDPQGSLGRWWELRGEPDNPRLVTNVETLAPAIATLRTMGIGWLFIDTPPAIIGTIEPAIRAADVVLVPVKASPLDIEAVDPVVQLCVRRGRPFAFVMSMVEPRSKLTESAIDYLHTSGQVLSEHVTNRQAYIAAMMAGRTGPEVEKDGKCRGEIDALWRSVKRMVAKMATVQV